MKIKYFYLYLLFQTSFNLYAENCPEKFGKYGNEKTYQNLACRIMVAADRTGSESYRNVTLSNEGAVQFFSNFPGTTNSNSTGARVFYLFPNRNSNEITETTDEKLALIQSSAVRFFFDKEGHFSSPDLKMKVSKEINSKNNGGVEIQSFPNGIIIDIGYRAGNDPKLNKNASVTITDKNQKKCSLLNSEIHNISKYDATFIYKTNDSLYKFLVKRCPGLDLSDLLTPDRAVFEKIPTSIDAPKNEVPVSIVDESRDSPKSSDQPTSTSTSVQEDSTSTK
jgi:hypothetical protein